ncbi:MAG: transglutaminase [Sphingomonas sanxanigenens]|uniref:Transglutaminase n=1 Tax=Sphingomonas sanxanigenens TaxID=397260 RepID=A0A2W5A636_9SPHN|nr:MAG: transglutaminase [Sphingomonas sanxanigenens]
MIYNIRHSTRFTYAAPARFARCNLRLKPIDWEGQHLLDYDLSVNPGGRISPARADASLANVDRVVVEQAVRGLEIVSSARVRIDRLVPVPSIDDPDLATVARLARESRDLSAAGPANYLFPSPLIPLDAGIADWCAESLPPGAGALEAGIALARRIQHEFEFDPAATVTETTPAEAFAKRRGVCQDFAQVMITGLRAAGLPAAYASGYIRTIPPPGQERLVGADATHAWVLLWCGPDRGWIGLDPTNGIWMAGDHIVMAIGRDYSEIAPIDGIVLGSGAQAMSVSVDVEPITEMAA